jgi:hypothetical protein
MSEEERLRPARQPSQTPQPGEEEIRGSAWMVAGEVLKTAAEVGGVVGGVAAVKSMVGGSKSGNDAAESPQGQTPSNDE